MKAVKTHPVIAIDGPSASGKSTVAKKVADHLPGFIYVDTGAMYRAITWRVIQEGINPRDFQQVVAFLEKIPFSCELKDRHTVPKCERIITPGELRSAEVAANVSIVASIPEIRERLVAVQRALGDWGPLVMEGRDIGSVVFPHTPYKFYLDAKPEVRSARRQGQGERDSIANRDTLDSTRAVAPLKVATDAVVIDSSSMAVSEVVRAILECLVKQGLPVVMKNTGS